MATGFLCGQGCAHTKRLQWRPLRAPKAIRRRSISRDAKEARAVGKLPRGLGTEPSSLPQDRQRGRQPAPHSTGPRPPSGGPSLIGRRPARRCRSSPGHPGPGPSSAPSRRCPLPRPLESRRQLGDPGTRPPEGSARRTPGRPAGRGNRDGTAGPARRGLVRCWRGQTRTSARRG